ncbi:hypothetical protein L208DRAFT_1324169 [Tricholoma matsutake]|nr:hypothetical protein L208DRAFT_1324169 [Tricholoma matsutake 945]
MIPHTIFSLYRTYLRQVNQLPLLYLRSFFRIKAADDFHSILRSTKETVSKHKLKRVSRDLRKITEANSGSSKAFAHVLDLAYGRKGKLKWEIMEPLLSDPNAPLPPRIIHSVEKSRPPVYSPEMKVILTSGFSRTTKPLSLKSLDFPTSLPIRANPASDDARLLGPLSKRREVNIRWRYFVNECKKVYPPLQVVVNDPSRGVHEGVKDADLLRVGIRGFGMQGCGVFEDISSVAGPLNMSKSLTRKERRNVNMVPEPASSHSTRHPSRWLRRRYQELLGRVPILTYSLGTNSSGSYSISLPRGALAPSLYLMAPRFPELKSIEDREWLALARGNDGRGPKHLK